MAKLSNDVSDARVDHEDVLGGGFLTELDEDGVNEHIVTAHLHVENDMVPSPLSEETLARIELYLTRHLIKFGPERQVESEGSGPSSRDYSGAFQKQSLEATAHGQTALSLDTTDTLGRTTSDEFYSVGGSNPR